MNHGVNSSAEQLRRRNRELAILNTIAQALNKSVDLDSALHTALAHAAELLDLQTGWVWLLREDNGDSTLAVAQNLPPGLVNNPELMEGSCYCLDTFRAGDMDGAANINVVTCSRLKKLVGGTDGLRYHASIPLYAHGKRLGVLNVASADWRELSPEDLRILYTVGDMLGIAIERAGLFTRSATLGAVEERNRLAREIHDTLTQGFTGIALQLEMADALIENRAGVNQIRQAVQQALILARKNIEEARRSVLDLRSTPLEGSSLEIALAELAADTTAKQKLPVRFKISGRTQSLPAHMEAGLYRIAREALANVLQHSNATRASLSLSITSRSVKLTIKDNGLGFDPGHIPPGHYGLKGLNERARLLGGVMHIHSTPGKGTEVVVEVKI